MKHCSGCHAEIADDLVDCGKHDDQPTPQAAREIQSAQPPRQPAGKHLFQRAATVLEKVEHAAIDVVEAGAEVALNQRSEF